MIVDNIMSEPAKSVSLEVTVLECQAIFSQFKFHHLPVLENERIVGIISDRDIAANACPTLLQSNNIDLDGTEHCNLFSKKIAQDIMSKDVITVLRETPIDVASILLLENRISCLPVLDDDSLVGILTWKDILSYHVYGKNE